MGRRPTGACRCSSRRVPESAARPRHDDSTTTRFGFLTAGAPLRTITLTGRFGFDAISRDGRSLFLTENVDVAAPGTHRVRMLDVATGVLRCDAIVDRKLDLEAGPSPARSRSTAMRRPERRAPSIRSGSSRSTTQPGSTPFVHALNTGWLGAVHRPPRPQQDGRDDRDGREAEGRHQVPAHRKRDARQDVAITCWRPHRCAGVTRVSVRAGEAHHVLGDEVQRHLLADGC